MIWQHTINELVETSESWIAAARKEKKPAEEEADVKDEKKEVAHV